MSEIRINNAKVGYGVKPKNFDYEPTSNCLTPIKFLWVWGMRAILLTVECELTEHSNELMSNY